MLSLDSTLPPEVCDASVWYGPHYKRQNDWMVCLSGAEIAEVQTAVEQIEQQSIDLTTITAQDVSLPTLGPRLRGMLDEVLKGRGFVLIKGLPVGRWTKRQAAVAFLVVGVQLGNLRMQNAEGHLLGHVRDLGRSSSDPNTRI